MELINAWNMEHFKIQYYNFACSFVWVSSVVSYTEEGTEAEVA
jgi:hypothetical protein